MVGREGGWRREEGGRVRGMGGSMRPMTCGGRRALRASEPEALPSSPSDRNELLSDPSRDGPLLLDAGGDALRAS